MSHYAQYQARARSLLVQEKVELSRLKRVMAQLDCTVEGAQRYLDLRDEGYSQYEAKLMAGLGDPPEPEDWIGGAP